MAASLNIREATDPGHEKPGDLLGEEQKRRDDRPELNDDGVRRDCLVVDPQPEHLLRNRQVAGRRHWQELGQAFDDAEQQRLQCGPGFHAQRMNAWPPSSGNECPVM